MIKANFSFILYILSAAFMIVGFNYQPNFIYVGLWTIGAAIFSQLRYDS